MLSHDLIAVPTQDRSLALVEGSGRKARDRIEHFLRAAIDNDNTRRAYGRSLGSFFAFLEDGGRARIQDIGPLDVRDYLEAAKANGLSTATLKQHMAAIRMLFDHLVTGGVLEHNPALSVKAPRQKLGKGKTPVLTAEEAGELLRSIENDTVIGLRDRALIGVMVFTSARISAACGLNVADIFHQQRRLWVRLHEKGGKFHEMPCHHTLEGYLAEYPSHGKGRASCVHLTCSGRRSRAMRTMDWLLHSLPIVTCSLVETAGARISSEAGKRPSTLLGARFRLLATNPMSSLT